MFNDALSVLKTAYGPHATFRDGQWEAIQSVLENKRTLVVQQTGWGKSVVYFTATKLLRKKKKGVTLIISPLLSLVRNQIASAAKFGLRAESINGTTIKTTNDLEHILHELRMNKIDMLFITPEQLAKRERMKQLREAMNIGFFVVDEAHCISDWGHDFRPDYRRITAIIKSMPPMTPVLATTATANTRVINDIQQQLGNIHIMRGPLARKSLAIHVVPQMRYTERLSWLATHIPKLSGSGIVYTITVQDSYTIARWLQSRGINAKAYNADIGFEERVQLEEAFNQNQMKCLVATVALGMGYDKPDVGFVIHFQRPGNIVSYYQQIGRAGRELHLAPTILLLGEEDIRIQDYFIQSAFPTEKEMKQVVDAIEASENGLTENQLLSQINISDNRLHSCIKYLEVENTLTKDEETNTFVRTPVKWTPNLKHSKQISEQRQLELQQVNQFATLKSCYMAYIAKQLDDSSTKPCMKCSNCTGDPVIPNHFHPALVEDATTFLADDAAVVLPRKQWPAYIMKSTRTMIPKIEQLQEGRALVHQGNTELSAEIDRMIEREGVIAPKILKLSVTYLRKWLGSSLKDKVLVAMPSTKHPQRLTNFVRELSRELQIPRADALRFTPGKSMQHELYNSYQSCANVMKHLEVTARCNEMHILLVDDFVQSRWTFTVAGHKLIRDGATTVTPFALVTKRILTGGE